MKIFTYFFVGLLTVCVVLTVNQYFFCPRFSFPPAIPFQGDSIYNPYASLKPDRWQKCNFHAHAREWNGVTNGHGSARQIHEEYAALNYDVHCVSNYHKIDTSNKCQNEYIPAYEHGYNIKKTHQLVLGEYNVQWIDYLLPQTLHNKQDVLNHLKNPNSLVILTHPALRKGYKPDDLSFLTNYDCLEVLNPFILSTEHWDAALSAGRKIFIAGDDDLHDITSKEHIGRMCTYVNVDSTRKQTVFHALKSGASLGVVIGKNQHPDSIPFMQNFQVDGNRVTFKMSQVPETISVHAQNGKEIAFTRNGDKVSFVLKPDHHYARATCSYVNGTQVFLNPVFFTSRTDTTVPVAHENYFETLFFRFAGIALLFAYLKLIGFLLIAKKTYSLEPGEKQKKKSAGVSI